MKVVAEEATLQCLELLKENLMEIRIRKISTLKDFSPS